MRELIQPGLFWVVRLGLFLSVVVWVVSQWWDVEILLHGSKHKVIATGLGIVVTDTWDDGFRFSISSGRLAGHSDPSTPRLFSDKALQKPDDGNSSQSRWGFNGIDDERGWVEIVDTGTAFVIPHPLQTKWRLACIGIGHGLYGRAIILSHWLNVTIFAAFYGVLKWRYRKRGREAMSDDP